MTDSIIVEQLGKYFLVQDPQRPVTLQESIVQGWRKRKAVTQVWALRGVNFRVRQGQMIGIVGANGAGKSTLLRLLGQVIRPDEGRVSITGRVGALLDIRAGFHNDLTGRENVYLGGIIGGLTRKQVSERFDSIVAFADLEHAIDHPLRTYSTGMMMRLGFAVAAHTDPEILLVDEVLAVGDLAFQSKCLERIRVFQKAGCTIVFVSHDMNQVRSLCDHALWLRAGTIVEQGKTSEVVKHYIESMHVETSAGMLSKTESTVDGAGIELCINENRFGSMELKIVQVRLLDSDSRAIKELTSESELCVELTLCSHRPVPQLILGVSVARAADGQMCLNLNSTPTSIPVDTAQEAARVVLKIEHLDLPRGKYYVSVGAYHHDLEYAYDYHWHAYELEVIVPEHQSVPRDVPHRWEWVPALESVAD